MIPVEWDDAKRQWTIANRGVDFLDLIGVFDDPAAIEVEDRRRDYGERRFVVLCPVDGRLYHVTYTLRGDRRRFISARKANQREQRHYARERQDSAGDRPA
ncbi:MAG: BrnT family toxin [Geminicoccaceae bacterium]